jgi:hypothetical protein
MPYADYTYYTETYKGNMPEEDFNRLSRQASAYLDSITFNRTALTTHNLIIQGKIKDACCAVTDIILKKDQGGELTSQSVGSWSRQFASSGKTIDQQQHDAASLYLAPTGLMYQGGGCGVSTYSNYL